MTSRTTWSCERRPRLQRAPSCRCASCTSRRRHLRLRLGDPATELNAAGEEGAAIVCVASRGRGNVRAGLLGSLSDRLARQASRLLLVVPPRFSARARTHR